MPKTRKLVQIRPQQKARQTRSQVKRKIRKQLHQKSANVARETQLKKVAVKRTF